MVLATIVFLCNQRGRVFKHAHFLLVFLKKSCCLLRAKQLRNLPHFPRSKTLQVFSLETMWFLLVFYLSNRLATKQQSVPRKTFSRKTFQASHILCFVKNVGEGLPLPIWCNAFFLQTQAMRICFGAPFLFANFTQYI